MNTTKLTLPAQSLSIFFKTQEDGTRTLNADFRSVPSNPEGATRAYFTGLDITEPAKAAIKALAKPARDKNGNAYLACGVVKAEVEVVAVRQPQADDQTPEVSFRVRVLGIERAEDTATADLAKLLG